MRDLRIHTAGDHISPRRTLQSGALREREGSNQTSNPPNEKKGGGGQNQSQNHSLTPRPNASPHGDWQSPHLVVDNYVDGTPDRVLGEGRHVQGLVNDTLAGEGAVPMKQDAHVLAAFFVIGEVLLCTYFSQQYRVHRLPPDPCQPLITQADT